MLALISCAGTHYMHGKMAEKTEASFEQGQQKQAADKEKVVRVKGVQGVIQSNGFI